jgi:hypothetical protein
MAFDVKVIALDTALDTGGSTGQKHFDPSGRHLVDIFDPIASNLALRLVSKILESFFQREGPKSVELGHVVLERLC